MTYCTLCFYILWNLFLCLTTPINYDNIECARHRKPWHMISDDERMQFVLGFQQLRENGVLSAFCETHHLEGIAFENIHKTSEFFFWHSYFVWELETQFRNLGDEYRCFSMPYWDITNDAQYLQDPDSDYVPIFDSFVGTDGNIDNNHCVDDELWNVHQYNTQFLCSEDEISPNCCLKRERNYNIVEMGNKTEITFAIKYHKFREFQDALSDIHGKVHKFFALTDESHMYSNNAAEDPIFVLLHSFIDYIRFMRSDCWEYDELSVDDIDEYIPFAFDRYIVDLDGDALGFKPTLDTAMQFAMICENKNAFCNAHDVTPRIMFDAQRWGISYELGTFWSQNDELQEFCGDHVNSTWFYNEDEMNVNKKEWITIDEYTLFNGVLYCILGVIIAILFLFIAIRQYATLYIKDHQMTTKLIQNHDSIGPTLYGAV